MLSYGLTSPTCTFVVVNILQNQHILIHNRVKWSSKNDFSLFLIQSLQIFDPAHECTDKTVTLQSLSSLESRKRTIRRLAHPTTLLRYLNARDFNSCLPSPYLPRSVTACGNTLLWPSGSHQSPGLMTVKGMLLIGSQQLLIDNFGQKLDRLCVLSVLFSVNWQKCRLRNRRVQVQLKCHTVLYCGMLIGLSP